MTPKEQAALKMCVEALNRAGFHAMARGHIEDTLFIAEAIAAAEAVLEGK